MLNGRDEYLRQRVDGPRKPVSSVTLYRASLPAPILTLSTSVTFRLAREPFTSDPVFLPFPLVP